MGINLREIIPAREIEIEDLTGKTIAIDAYNVLYQFLSIIRDRFTGEPLRDSKGRITSHLSGLFYRTSKLLEVGIKPIFVFDGEPPKFKKEVVESRTATRKKAEIRWKEALEKGDVETVRIASQAASKLTDEMIEESKKLLDYMGIPWIQAPSEGEAEAAFLAKKKMVWATGSQDWDSMLFGTPRLVRNLTVTGRRKVPRKEKYIVVKPEIIELDDVLKSLNIDQNQLILLGVLIGTDYNPGGIKGVGPKTALEIVKRQKTFDNVFKTVSWSFKTTPQEIFEFFKNPPVKEEEIKKKKLDPNKIRDMLVKEHEFSEERIGSVIKKLQEAKDEEKQSKIEKFFGK